MCKGRRGGGYLSSFYIEFSVSEVEEGVGSDSRDFSMQTLKFCPSTPLLSPCITSPCKFPSGFFLFLSQNNQKTELKSRWRGEITQQHWATQIESSRILRGIRNAPCQRFNCFHRDFCSDDATDANLLKCQVFARTSMSRMRNPSFLFTKCLTRG